MPRRWKLPKEIWWLSADSIGHHPFQESIAAFKLRVGMPIGLKVTLRGERMYHFLDKLMNVVLPRIREFNGVSRMVLTVLVIIRWVLKNRPFSRDQF